MRYKNEQLENNLEEVTRICKQVAANTRGIRLTLTPVTEEVMTVCEFTHVLDVGEEFSFFYTNEAEAIKDQATLCTHLRIRGMAIAKVIKNQPLTIQKQ